MKNRYFQSKIDYLDLLFNYFDNLSIDEYHRSHIAKYITVIISGVYEDLVKKGIEDFLNDNNIKVEVKNYINNTLKKSFRNPDAGNLKSLLKSFSKDWFDKITSLGADKVAALDSVVNNKNLIAHGQNCNITYLELKDYYVKTREILTALDEIFTK